MEKQEGGERLPRPLDYTDLNSGELNSQATPGGMAQVTGYRLKFDPADTSQGIFFVNGSATRVSMVGKNNPSELMFLIPASMTAGDLTAADQSLALGLTASQAHGHCDTCESLLLPVAVSIRVAQGNLTSVETFAGHLDKAATRYGSRIWLALATQARGNLAAARGEIEAAVDCFKEAQAGFQAAGNEVEVTRCQEALAQLNSP